MTRKVLLSGGSGLIGRALRESLARQGVDVVRLVRDRRQGGKDAVFWQPESEQPVEDADRDTGRLEGCEAAIHLGGANLADHRWTAAYRQVIVNSRVHSSQALVRVLRSLREKPPELVAASATGIYGDRGDEVLTEDSSPGMGFLPDVCQRWEAASDGARQLGLRVVHLRLGVVLSREGGALKTMLPMFRAGLGGRLGDGRQWMSWLSLPDAVRAIEFALEHEALDGACNAVAPSPVTNADWTEMLGRMLHRPAALAVPAFALRAAFGRMAQDTMLASTRAVPERLLGAGFHFAHERIQTALAAVL